MIVYPRVYNFFIVEYIVFAHVLILKYTISTQIIKYIHTYIIFLSNYIYANNKYINMYLPNFVLQFVVIINGNVGGYICQICSWIWSESELSIIPYCYFHLFLNTSTVSNSCVPSFLINEFNLKRNDIFLHI